MEFALNVTEGKMPSLFVSPGGMTISMALREILKAPAATDDKTFIVELFQHLKDFSDGSVRN